MLIPHEQISPDTLDRLIEEFVTRDGTETSDAAVKIAQVRRQLDAGRVVISYDEEDGTVTIVPVDPPGRPTSR